MIRRNALWLCKNHFCEDTAPSLPQSCAAVSAALEVSRRAVQWSQLLSKSPADLRRGLRSSKIWLFYKSNLGAPENALAESVSTLPSSRGVWEHLEVLRSTDEGARSVWKDCVLLLDRFTFCWCWSIHRSWSLAGGGAWPNGDMPEGGDRVNSEMHL